MEGKLWDYLLSKSSREGKINSVSIEITRDCPFNCLHCYKTKSPAYISEPVFFRIIKQAEDAGATSISFNGGEPFSHYNIIPFTEEVVKKGFFLTILTNGFNLELPETLISHNALRFQISIYGSDDKTSEFITGVPESFSRVMKNILRIRDLGGEVSVTVSALETPENEPWNVISFLEKEEIPWNLTDVISTSENGDGAHLIYRPDENFLMKILAVAGPMYFKELNVSSDCKVNSTAACGAGVSSLAVNTSGDVFPCLVFQQKLGNILSENLKTILESKKLAEFRESNILPEKCRTCNLYNFCSRCPGTVRYDLGQGNVVNPENCRIAAIKNKFLVYSEGK
ncbi:MAG: radical SAM protein [Deltaproteobacteria bacterium]|nr:radical SAM protein [Deltaproteobacteria bacterium]